MSSKGRFATKVHQVRAEGAADKRDGCAGQLGAEYDDDSVHVLNQQLLRRKWLLDFQEAFHHAVAVVLIAAQSKVIISNTRGMHGTARSPLVPGSAPILLPGLRSSRNKYFALAACTD